jgi:hypothetical protein
VSGDIRVDADVLHQHAAVIDQLAAEAGRAVSAISSVNLSGGAFGVMCAFLVPPVAIVSGAVGAAIANGQDAISRTAGELRLAVGDFAQREQSTVDTIEGVGRALDA